MKKTEISFSAALDLIRDYCALHDIGIDIHSLTNIELSHPIYDDEGMRVGTCPRSMDIDAALAMAAPLTHLSDAYTLVFETGKTEKRTYSRMKVAFDEAQNTLKKRGETGMVEILRGGDFLLATIGRKEKSDTWTVRYIWEEKNNECPTIPEHVDRRP